eukprot:1745345-Pleurochrysis_carterae.AAC.1
MLSMAATRTRRRTGCWRPVRRHDPRHRFWPGRGPYLHVRSRLVWCEGRLGASAPPGCLRALLRCT